MTTAYTPILKLALPVTGELNGTWGDVVNNNITSMVEQAVAGLATINTWTANSHTLTSADGTTSESRCAMLVIDDDGAGNPSAAATVICPTATKAYIVQNLCGQTVTVKTAAGSGVAVPNNQSALVFCNGTDVVTGAFNGDVVGPASATDNAVARYDGTTGKIIQNSAVTIGDDGATVIAANSSSDGLRITQVGSGNALLVEDSANPDSNPFVVTADGNVIVGTTTPTITTYPLYIEGSGALAITGSNVAATSPTIGIGRRRTGGASVGNGDSIGKFSNFGWDGTNFIEASRIEAAVDGTPGTNDMPGRLVFSTTADGASSPTEAMRIDNQRRVGIGATPFAGSNVFLGKAITGATTSYGIYQGTTVQSDVTGAALSYVSTIGTQASAFTLGSLIHYRASQASIGATSAVTNQYGFEAQSTLTGATNNYGFYGAIASGTGRWNFYAAGTAENVFIGNTAIGTTAATAKLTVSGTTHIIGAGAFPTTGVGIELVSAAAGGTNYIQTYNRTGAAWQNLEISSAQTVFGTGGSERIRIGSTGTISLGAAPGAESLRVTPVASAVNYLDARGGVTGGSPYIISTGSDTNVGLNLTTKGASNIGFSTNNFGSSAFVIAHTASAVNYWQFTGAATGGSVAAYATGSDANVSTTFATKGNGSHVFSTNTGANPQFLVAHTASAVNYLQVTGGATGNAATLSAQGSDTNIDIALTPKGSGYVVVDAAYSPNLTLTDAATITWDTSTAGGQVATFTFVSSNRTMGAPTNLKNGGFYALAVIQNAGSNTLTWNAVFKWAGGTAPTLSTAAGAKDYFVFRSDGTNLYQQGISQAVA